MLVNGLTMEQWENDNIYSSYGGCKLLKHKDNMLSRLHRGPRWGDWLLWRCWCWHRTHVRWQRKWECVDVCVVIYTTMQIFGIVFHLSWKVILLLMTWNVTRKINIKNFIRFFCKNFTLYSVVLILWSFQLLPCHKEVTTADSATCLIWQSFILYCLHMF